MATQQHMPAQQHMVSQPTTTIVAPIYSNPFPNDSHLLDYCFQNPEWAIKCYYRNQHNIRKIWNLTMIGLPPSNIPTRIHTPQPLYPHPQMHPQLHLYSQPNPPPQTIQPHIVPLLIP